MIWIGGGNRQSQHSSLVSKLTINVDQVDIQLQKILSRLELVLPKTNNPLDFVLGLELNCNLWCGAGVIVKELPTPLSFDVMPLC